MHAINVTVDAGRRASAPIGAGIICNNSDWALTFTIDAASGFDLSAPINCVFVTKRGALPPVQFMASGSVTAPQFTYADGTLVYVGLTQGDIKTTAPAKLAIIRSIFSEARGHEAEPDPGPVNPPVVTEVTLDDLLLISDVEHGRQVLITLQTLSDLIGSYGAGITWITYEQEEAFLAVKAAVDADEAVMMRYLGKMAYLADYHYTVPQSGLPSGTAVFRTISDGTELTEITITWTDSEDTWSTETVAEPVEGVKYTEQSLTAAQKAQARSNIGAGVDTTFTIEAEQEYESGEPLSTYRITTSYSDYVAALAAGNLVRAHVVDIDNDVYLDQFRGNANGGTAIGFAAPLNLNYACLLVALTFNGGDNKFNDISVFKLSIPTSAAVAAKYTKPDTGIPSTDLATGVQSSLGKADKAVRFDEQSLTTAQQAQARSNIGAASLSDIGTVFSIKGDVATVNDLPATGNAVGDVWYVQSVSAGFVWLETTERPSGYWEELGEPIDLSAYRTAAAQDVIDAGKVAVAQGAGNAGKFLVVNSSGNVEPMTMSVWQGGSY